MVPRLEKLGTRLAPQLVRRSLPSKIIILSRNAAHQRELSRLVLPKRWHLNHIILVDDFEHIKLLQSLLLLVL